MKPEWEPVCGSKDEFTRRLRVPGGWLYRQRVYCDEGSPTLAMVFVPEPTPEAPATDPSCRAAERREALMKAVRP